jgi:hypothetical protein
VSAHPALAPYADFGVLAATPGLAAWNARARAAGLAHPSGVRLRFVAQEVRSPALAYERRIAAAGEIPLREGDPHDAWNARVWLAFPRTKSALNAIHVAAGAAAAPNARSPGRNAATLLDESGALVACIDPEFVACWRRHAWREAFGGPAAILARRLAVVVVGHGLLARLYRPFRGLTARALVLPLDPDALPADAAARRDALDAAAAARLAGTGRGLVPGDLLPLPLAAMPDWDPAAAGDARFADLSVFRPVRRPRNGAAAT